MICSYLFMNHCPKKPTLPGLRQDRYPFRPDPFYPSDLTDVEWEIIDFMLPLEKQRGKKRQVDFRQVVNAIFYRADNGIKWRAMPVNFPTWQTVYRYYCKWVKSGLWESINALLVEQVRTESGRAAQPS